ncbi:unnamed protein product, partial [Ectocarpus fasciculatus]
WTLHSIICVLRPNKTAVVQADCGAGGCTNGAVKTWHLFCVYIQSAAKKSRYSSGRTSKDDFNPYLWSDWDKGANNVELLQSGKHAPPCPSKISLVPSRSVWRVSERNVRSIIAKPEINSLQGLSRQHSCVRGGVDLGGDSSTCRVDHGFQAAIQCRPWHKVAVCPYDAIHH